MMPMARAIVRKTACGVTRSWRRWWQASRARGGAHSVAFDAAQIDPDLALQDGMVWNMRYRPARAEAARLVNRPEKYDRLLDIIDSPANAGELCLGSLQDMPGDEIYSHVRRFARRQRMGCVHFRNVKGRVPAYVETFVDEGDIDMAEIVRILRDEGYQGVLIPDHTPGMTCAAPWHAGMAFALGYMRGLVQNAAALGPSWSNAKEQG